jgi:hypothetical protein
MRRFSVASLPLNTLSFVPLLVFHAKDFRPPQALEGRKRTLELAYYINHGFFRRLEPRQNVSGLRNVLGKIFLETLFMQNLSFHGAG